MKNIALLCLTVLLASITTQAQSQSVQIPAPKAPNGTYYCPSGFKGPIQSTPGGAWICIR